MFGLKGAQDAHPQGGQAVEKSALQGKDQKAAEKGAALGDEAALLAGLGYNPADKQALQKNVAEKANIERFMQEVVHDSQKTTATDDKKGDAFLADKNGKTDADERLERDRGEKSQAIDDAKLDDHIDDVRAHVTHEAKQEREHRDVRETKEHQKDRDQDQNQDEQEKHGTPWIQEEIEHEEEKKRRRAIRLDDALGAEARCHGTLSDGSRCLRRPVPGTPYCREHVFPSQP
jgi:hypothetical protein